MENRKFTIFHSPLSILHLQRASAFVAAGFGFGRGFGRIGTTVAAIGSAGGALADGFLQADDDGVDVVNDLAQSLAHAGVASHHLVDGVQGVDGFGQGVEGVVGDGAQDLHAPRLGTVALRGGTLQVDGVEGGVCLLQCVGRVGEADGGQGRDVGLFAKLADEIGQDTRFRGIVYVRQAAHPSESESQRGARLFQGGVGLIGGMGQDDLFVEVERLVAFLVGCNNLGRVQIGFFGVKIAQLVVNGLGKGDTLGGEALRLGHVAGNGVENVGDELGVLRVAGVVARKVIENSFHKHLLF